MYSFLVWRLKEMGFCAKCRCIHREHNDVVKSTWKDIPHGNKMSPASIWVDVTTLKCTISAKWLTESQHMFSLPHRFWHHGKRAIVMEIQNPVVETKKPHIVFSCQHFGWWCPTRCAKQCHQTHFSDLSWQPRSPPPPLNVKWALQLVYGQ